MDNIQLLFPYNLALCLKLEFLSCRLMDFYSNLVIGLLLTIGTALPVLDLLRLFLFVIFV